MADKPTAPAAAPKSDAKPPRKARKVNPALKDETKEAKFMRIARPRVTRVLAAMKKLETIGRSSGYAYTPEQATKLVQHLVDGVSAVKVAFAPRMSATKAGQELVDL